jgi:hypothetical protein
MQHFFSMAGDVGRKMVGAVVCLLVACPVVHAVDCENGKFYNERTEMYETCRPLPDLTRCKYLGKKGSIDKIDTIPGAETTLTSYQCGDDHLTVYTLPDGTVYGYAVHNMKAKEVRWYWDYDEDGNFESGIKIIL